MNYRNRRICAILGAVALALPLMGCSLKEETAAQELDTTEMFTNRDMDSSYDEEEAVVISLSDDGSECASDGVEINGNEITIKSEGQYIISGKLTDGQLVIDADDSKVQVILAGVEITNDDSAAIYVKSADKVFVTLKENTENILTTSGEFAESENNVDGVVFSKADITFNGEGSLAVESKYGHGIVSKDDLKITSGSYTITAAKHGIAGKDSVRIADGSLTITAGKDGIHSDNTEDSDKGYVYVADGEISISSEDDGIHAAGILEIDDGSIEVTNSYEGLEGLVITLNGGNIDIVASDDGINAAGGNDSSGFGGFGEDKFSASDDSWITINGGCLQIDAGGDGIDSNGNLYVNGGEIYVNGPTNDGNAAIDYGDGASATITGGTIVAVGGSGMAENFGDDSTQGSMLVVLDASAEGEEVVLTDSTGNEIVSFDASKSYDSVLISCSEIEAGQTYTLTVGSESKTIEMDSNLYSNKTGGFNPGNNRPGNGGPGNQDSGNQDSGNQPPDGEAPNMQKPDDKMEAPNTGNTENTENTSI